MIDSEKVLLLSASFWSNMPIWFAVKNMFIDQEEMTQLGAYELGVDLFYFQNFDCEQNTNTVTNNAWCNSSHAISI